MKKLFTLLLISFSLSAACKKDEMVEGFYLGGDFQIRRLCYKECPSSQKMINYSPRTNGYVGYRFNEYIGVEVGYGHSSSRNKNGVTEATQVWVKDKGSDLDTSNIAGAPNDILQNMNSSVTETPTEEENGRFVTEFEQLAIRNKLIISGLHFNFIGFYPLPDFRATELIGSIGAFSLRSSFTSRVFGEKGEVSSFKTLSTGVPIIRITMGIQTMLTQALKLRFTVGWMNTSKQTISYGYSKCGVSLLPILTTKDTLFYGVGLNWKF